MPEIQTFENEYAFTFESRELGRIRMWRATTRRGRSALEIHFLRREQTSRDFMLCLLSVTASPEDAKNPRQKGEHLTSQQLSVLSDEELDEIAGQFLLHHTYFGEDPRRLAFESVQTKDGEGVEVKLEPLDLPRGAEESNVDYLQRLVAAHCKAQKEATEKAMADLSEGMSKIMTPDISALTNMNSGISDSISRAIDSIQANFNVGQEMASFAPHILPPKNPQHRTNDLLADIMDTLSEQKPFNAEMVRAIQALNERAEKSEADNKALAKKSNRQMWISIAIGFIATIATIAGVVIAYWGYKALLPQ
jgi:hypothetical protein